MLLEFYAHVNAFVYVIYVCNMYVNVYVNA